jgi:hypothetical protein
MSDQYNDDEYDDDDDRPDLPWPPAVPPPYPEPPGRSRTSKIILLTLTAAVAAAAGYLVVTAIRDVSASPATASATPSTTPTSPAQGGLPTGGSGNSSGNGGGALPIPSTGPGETLHLEIGGTVSAVTPTSITLGAHGQSVTAAVTKSTTITGKVHAISGIKAGDLVSAQIVSTDGKLTATAIQDPASIP